MEKVMDNDDGKTLASFNVGAKQWQKFKELARKENRSASACLNELIDQAINRQSISDIDTYTPSIPDIDLSSFVTNNDFDGAIATINQRMDAVESRFAELPEKDEDSTAMAAMEANFTAVSDKQVKIEGKVSELTKNLERLATLLLNQTNEPPGNAEPFTVGKNYSASQLARIFDCTPPTVKKWLVEGKPHKSSNPIAQKYGSPHCWKYEQPASGRPSYRFVGLPSDTQSDTNDTIENAPEGACNEN